MTRKEKLLKIHKLCKNTIDFLKRSAGKKFRQLTIGKTGTQFSKEIIDLIHETDRKLRAIWDYQITKIVRSVTSKIEKIQVKIPSKKKFFHDESLMTDFDFIDAYTITQEDADDLIIEIQKVLTIMAVSLLQVLEKQQKTAFLLGEKKASRTLYNEEILTSFRTLTETDLKILQDELEFQKEHLQKFIEKLENKYRELLYSDPGDPWPVYKTQQDLMKNVEDVDSTSIHQLDLYAIAGVETAMMQGTVEPLKQAGVGGGVWHTMHDGTVCPECSALDGVWMTWDEFYSIYKNTLCNGSCRCGELFEPTNNTVDPYSDTYGKEYYLKDSSYPKPCIQNIANVNLSIFRMMKVNNTEASPGSIGCALIQNAEKSARKFFTSLSSTKKSFSKKFSVSPQVDFSSLGHFFTPSSAQYRTQLYRALNKFEDKLISKLQKKINSIELVTSQEFVNFGGSATNAVSLSSKKVLINSNISPYSLSQDLSILFNYLLR